jgi:hypothetical protein
MATRFLFEPPLRQKTKPSAGIKTLLVRCPSTSKLTDTGKTVEEKRWPATKMKMQKSPARIVEVFIPGLRRMWCWADSYQVEQFRVSKWFFEFLPTESTGRQARS